MDRWPESEEAAIRYLAEHLDEVGWYDEHEGIDEDYTQGKED